MTHFKLIMFVSVLVLLILLSAFFSAAETGLMAINRYRLRHKAKLKKRSAILILKLLERPDRLLGTILIGNSCANIIAASLATLLAVYFFGEKGVILSTILLTFVILIFAEVAPKTVAALYPERVSTFVAWPISVLLAIFYPLVWLTNFICNGFLRIFGIKFQGNIADPLTREELRTVVYETSGRISSQYQNMLLGILDLNNLTIDDVMIPRHEIMGIDLESEWEEIQKQLATSQHDWLPVYKENINNALGILHLRELMHASLNEQSISKEVIMKLLHETYFVPEGTSLNIQLMNFQRKRKRIALVVDEYGEITGLVTLEDILEEIVGEFTTNVAPSGRVIEIQSDGSYMVEGAITIRELNRVTQWKFSTKGPRTLSGLIIEHLEAIPRAGLCILIDNYPIEIVSVKENRVNVARIFPALPEKQNEIS